ncbi:MAG: HD domain-containing protein [Bacilli bacterium]|nr:HD domain-containing protein [Bacilli bacterium]MDD4643657.1 HD domain-containing protein [Bacilli bacterium]
MMFERIKNDPYIYDCYKGADNPNSKEGFWVYHGLKHVNNVVEMVEKILIQLEYDNEYIENAKIAALLHDMGYGGIKKDHEIRSCEMVKKHFEGNNIELKYKNEILDAIKAHREGFESDNVMALVLILADKIDIKKTRLAPDGYKVEGLNQYQYIEDIRILKNDNNLRVQFIINKNCNKEKLEEWYFTAKVFNAIKSFANRFNFGLKILWNDEEWT